MVVFRINAQSIRRVGLRGNTKCNCSSKCESSSLEYQQHCICKFAGRSCAFESRKAWSRSISGSGVLIWIAGSIASFVSNGNPTRNRSWRSAIFAFEAYDRIPNHRRRTSGHRIGEKSLAIIANSIKKSTSCDGAALGCDYRLRLSTATIDRDPRDIGQSTAECSSHARASVQRQKVLE